MSGLRESYDKGQRDRAALKRRFGFVPQSVLKLSRGALHRSMHHLAAESARNNRVDNVRRFDAIVGDEAKAKAHERRAAGLYGSITELGPTHNRETVSTMSAELVDFFVRYYATRGSVYLDPFAAQGVQMQVAALRGLHYLGGDASVEYVRYCNAVLDRLDVADGQRIEVRAGDSRHADWIDDGIGDFSFYSPPYWDVEYYGPEPEQLGTGHTYPQFLDGMTEVARAWHPKFKPGAYVVVNVNDMRREGEFIPYHSDVIALMQRAGYRMHDVWIIEGLVAGLPRAFAVSFNMRRIAPRLHEYALVFRA